MAGPPGRATGHNCVTSATELGRATRSGDEVTCWLMAGPPEGSTLVATIDVSTLQTVRWGLMRQLFPRFVEELELGRFVRKLLQERHYRGVHLEPHHDAAGRPSPHVFDVYALPLEQPTA